MLNLYRSSTINPPRPARSSPGSKIMKRHQDVRHPLPPVIGERDGTRGSRATMVSSTNGLDQTIMFLMNRQLGSDVVLDRQPQHCAPRPIAVEVASLMDSFNVGLAPNVCVGHDRFHDSSSGTPRTRD